MEFALVHDNQLLLGPIGFNVRMINSELEDLELDDRISTQSYSQVPIHFSDGLTHLVPATKTIPDHNPKYHNVGNFNWEIVEDIEDDIAVEVKFVYPINNKSLDQIKDEYKAAVKPERQRRENTSVEVNINNSTVTVSTDRENRLALTSKYVAGPGPHNFKFDNGTWLEVTTEDLQTIIQAVDAKVQEAYDWELAKLAEIDACENGEEVYAVVIVPPVERPERPEVIANAQS
jgi:hypothetical protein